MPATYEPIQTTTLTSAQATVTFSSIPSTYTDLVLIVVPQGNSGYDVRLNFNNDTNTNYSYTVLYGTGTTAGSVRSTNQPYVFTDYYGSTGSTTTSEIIHIMNYSNTTTNKTLLSRANNAASGVDALVGLWRSTAAINRIDIQLQTAGTFASGSTFTLYGIKAA